MALDPSIILGAKAPDIQIQNPIDNAIKMAQVKSLSDLGQIRSLEVQKAQREDADDQAVRSAYQDNITQGPDGSPIVNRQGVLSTLMGKNPQLAVREKQKWQQNDLAQLQQQQQIRQDLLAGVYDQQSWTDALQKGKELGLPTDHLSPIYDKGNVDQMRAQSQSVHDQITEQLERQKLDLQRQDLAVKRDQQRSDKQNQAMGNTLQMLDSARQGKAANQAEMDLYASQKASSLFNRYAKDPNNMSSAEVQLYATEIAKMASGGTPSIHELAGLNPSTVPKTLAEAAQKAMNHPTGAQAGEFLQRFKEYGDSLATEAKKVITDRYGRVIESSRGRIGEQNYQTLQQQYINRFNNPEDSQQGAPGGGGGKPQSVIQNGHTYNLNPQTGEYE